MKRSIIIVLALGLLLAGFFVPLGSYTSTGGCPINPTPVSRLHLIRGQTLSNQKKLSEQHTIGEGCYINTRYVLYFF